MTGIDPALPPPADHGKTIRGSIVGTRLDLIESLRFAAAGKVHVHCTVDSL